MSYWVYLEIDGGNPEHPVDVYDRNSTSNVAGIWRKAGIDIAECDGRSAPQVAEGLAVAIGNIESDRDAYKHLEPANGWGDIDSCLSFLRDLLGACQRYPKATMRVSR